MASVAFHLSQRVHAAGDPARVGTVRYLGPVEGHSGDWVGIDWDASAGGRHDGSLAGRRYFHAAGERSASFARPTALSAGITLPDALRNRYRVDDFTKEEEDEMYVFSTSQKRVSVELVGKNKVQEKLKNFNELISASVSYMEVTTTGPLDELKNLVPNLRQLDLTGNILSQWQVSPRERREAEIRSVNPLAVKNCQCRFAELKAFHGIEDEKPIPKTSGPQKMASGLISITLKCVGPSMGEKQPLTKKLPPATTVGKLKSLCESFFKLKDVKLRLYLEEEGCPLPQFLEEEETASLMELGIGTGATVIVDEES
ncbi:hypothetical protein ABZP36_014026 [Zizania latifolia]